jgi:hypothetical protein
MCKIGMISRGQDVKGQEPARGSLISPKIAAKLAIRVE